MAVMHAQNEAGSEPTCHGHVCPIIPSHNVHVAPSQLSLVLYVNFV